MNRKNILALTVVLALGGAATFLLLRHGRSAPGSPHAGHDHAGHSAHADHDAEIEKGPHGGRLLRRGSFAVELAIVEKGLPPEFRAWFTVDGKPVPPAEVRLSVELKRITGAIDRFTFTPEGDYARGSGEVQEPHSFDYTVVAEHGGRPRRWDFSAPELQTTLPAEAARRAGVVVATAEPATLHETLGVYGQVKPDLNRIARATPRFAGLIRATHKALGETVAAGDLLAVVEANASLVSFEVRAPIGGLIIERAANVGEAVAEGAALYVIADFSQVWIDFHLPPREQTRVRVGQPVTLRADDGGPPLTLPIALLSPVASAEAQTIAARVVAPNSDGRWRPGLFVTGAIAVSATVVPVAVRESALQTLFDFTVVFSQHGDVYQARPLTLGRRADGWVEVLKGLSAGERYVVENSFLLKADIGKSGAAHDH